MSLEDLVMEWNKTANEDVYIAILRELTPLVNSCVRRYALWRREDLVQEARLAILKACKTFDNTRNDQFKAHAYYAIKWAIYHYARADQTLPIGSPSGHEKTCAGHPAPTSHSEILQLVAKKGVQYKTALKYALMCSPQQLEFHDIGETRGPEYRTLIQEIVNQVELTSSGREKEIYYRYMFEGDTVTQMAKEYKITKQRVSEVVRTTTKRLRRVLA